MTYKRESNKNLKRQSRNLKYIRVFFLYDYHRIAKYVGMLPETYLTWENGKAAPCQKNREKVAKLFHFKKYNVLFLPHWLFKLYWHIHYHNMQVDGGYV